MWARGTQCVRRGRGGAGRRPYHHHHHQRRAAPALHPRRPARHPWRRAPGVSFSSISCKSLASASSLACALATSSAASDKSRSNPARWACGAAKRFVCERHAPHPRGVGRCGARDARVRRRESPPLGARPPHPLCHHIHAPPNAHAPLQCRHAPAPPGNPCATGPGPCAPTPQPSASSREPTPARLRRGRGVGRGVGGQWGLAFPSGALCTHRQALTHSL